MKMTLKQAFAWADKLEKFSESISGAGAAIVLAKEVRRLQKLQSGLCPQCSATGIVDRMEHGILHSVSCPNCQGTGQLDKE